MNNQFYNLSQPSKNTLEKDRKNRLAAENFLQERNERIAAREQEKILNEKASLMTGAYYANASAMVHSKRRTQALTEEIKYANTAPTIAMAALVSELVESSLLFDTKEYEKYYPNFREDIQETVANLLENANTNFSEMDERTQILLRYVEDTLPAAKEGKYLSEGDITRLVKQEKPAEVEAAINSLTGDVANRVAVLVEKEQKRVEEINDELGRAGVADKIEQVEDEHAPVADEPDQEQLELSPEAEEILTQLNDGSLSTEDYIQMAQNGEIAPEIVDEIGNAIQYLSDNGGQVQAMQQQEAPAEEEVQADDMSDIPAADAPVPSEVAPQQGSGKSIHIAADGTMGITMPNGQLALNQDGSMDIQLMESIINEAFGRRPLLTRFIQRADDDQLNKLVTKMYKKEKFRRAVDMELDTLLSISLDKKRALVLKIMNLKHNSKEAAAKFDQAEKQLENQENLKESFLMVLGILELVAAGLCLTLSAVQPTMIVSAISGVLTGITLLNVNKRLGNLEDHDPIKRSEEKKRLEKRLAELKENKLIKETPRSGLLESLAVNEAVNMIKEGKEYNSEACISNALLFVTITEAMSELGLLDVNDRTYADVVRRAGGTLNEVRISQNLPAGSLGVGKRGNYGVIDHSGDALDPTSPKAINLQRRYNKLQQEEEEENIKKENAAKRSSY